MAYDTTGLHLTGGAIGFSDDQTWTLNTTDVMTTVRVSDYIDDGVTRGMKQGDIVCVKVRASLPRGAVSAVHQAFVIDVGTGADAQGVDITDGLEITATDTD